MSDDASRLPESKRWSRRSRIVQALGTIDEASRAVVPPIHVATTFLRDPDNQYRSGNVYGRPDNETIREAERMIGLLEGAAAAMVFGSGMSAAIAVFMALKPGDHIVAPKVMYWALRGWLLNDAAEWGLETSFVDATSPADLAAAIIPGRTKLVWIETPANPLWGITDIAEAARIAHAAGARLAVDSTGATPILTRPLEHGADIVMHAATKYLNGHSDVVAGALAVSAADAFWARIKRVRAIQGLILGPLEGYLLIRGMRTLHLRVEAACRNAMELATRLSNHPAVLEVLYPGLETHPGHAIAKRQMQGGFGGMLSIRLRPRGDQSGEAMAIRAAGRVSLWKRATSLGGVESLIEHRGSIEGPGSPCPLDLLRLSTGIEDVEDLYRDLDQAMAD